MTPYCFDQQIERLKTRFGDKAFDGEFVSLVAKTLSGITDDELISVVDLIIGEGNPKYPPKLSDIREARYGVEKNRFSQAMREASQSEPFRKGDLKKILDEKYKGCKSAFEAVERERLKIIKESNGSL